MKAWAAIQLTGFVAMAALAVGASILPAAGRGRSEVEYTAAYARCCVYYMMGSDNRVADPELYVSGASAGEGRLVRLHFTGR